MNDNIPSVILCYAPEDDWLARGIVDGIDEKEFYIQLNTWCVQDVTKLWQRIREAIDDCSHFLILLTPHSVAKVWPKSINEDELPKLTKRSRLIPIVHGEFTDQVPPSLLKIPVHAVDERCDIDHLVEYIKKLNTNPEQSPKSRNTNDRLPKLSTAEIDAKFIAKNFLFRASKFKVKIA